MPQYFLTDADIAWLKALRQTVSGISGPGVYNDGVNVRIQPTLRADAIPDDPYLPRMFIITGIATPPGTYVASTFVPSPTALPASSATMWTSAQLGTSLGDRVYIYNLQEQGKSAAEPSQWDLKKNALDNGLQPIVTAIFHSIADDGTPVYLIWAPIAQNCGQ